MLSLSRVLSALLLLVCACARPDLAAEAAAAERRALQQKTEALLKGFDRKLAELRLRADASAGRAREEAREAVSALEEKKTSVQLKLERLKTSTKDNTREAADNLRAAAQDLEDGFRDASSRLR
jgi:hypothetical protein